MHTFYINVLNLIVESSTYFEHPNLHLDEDLYMQLYGIFFLYPFNPLKPELNSICYLLALLGAHHFLHVSRIRVKSLTFRRLMSYVYDISRLRVKQSGRWQINARVFLRMNNWMFEIC